MFMQMFFKMLITKEIVVLSIFTPNSVTTESKSAYKISSLITEWAVQRDFQRQRFRCVYLVTQREIKIIYMQFKYFNLKKNLLMIMCLI